MIDKTKCMSRKNKHRGINLQCSNKKKYGDYCGIHYKCNNIFRIDIPLPPTVKTNKMDLFKFDITKIIKTQSYIRKFIILRKIYRLYGPAYKNILECSNDKDPISLETIYQEIRLPNNLLKKIKNLEFPKYKFFSMIIDNKIYGFNINTIHQLIKQNINKPITYKSFTENEKKNILERIKYMENKNIINKEIIQNKTIKDYYIDICNQFELFDIYIDVSDLLEIEDKLLLVYQECNLIWNHSENYAKKKEIEKITKKRYFSKKNNNDNVAILKEILSFITIEQKTHCNYTCMVLLTGLSYISNKIKQIYEMH